MGRSDSDLTAWARGSLVLVAGKGGSGKTTLAGAIGVRLSRSRPCLVLSADAGALSRLMGTKVGPDPAAVEWAPGLWIGALDLWQALEDFGRLRLGNSRVVRALVRSWSARGFLDALPGLGGLALLGRAWHHCSASSSQGRFDTVILDVSGRGHLGRLLGQPAKLATVLPFGPLRRDLDELSSMLADSHSSQIVAVTLPEAYSVSETLELVGEVGRAGRRIDRIVVNGLWPAWLEACRSEVSSERLPGERLWRFGAGRLAAQRAAIAALQPTGLPLDSVPFVSSRLSPRDRLGAIADALW